MNEAKFRDLVRRLRLAQKRYFTTRDGYDLQHAKGLEREVDAALDAPVEKLTQSAQGDLFAQEGGPYGQG